MNFDLLLPILRRSLKRKFFLISKVFKETFGENFTTRKVFMGHLRTGQKSIKQQAQKCQLWLRGLVFLELYKAAFFTRVPFMVYLCRFYSNFQRLNASFPVWFLSIFIVGHLRWQKNRPKIDYKPTKNVKNLLLIFLENLSAINQKSFKKGGINLRKMFSLQEAKLSFSRVQNLHLGRQMVGPTTNMRTHSEIYNFFTCIPALVIA